MGTVVPSSPYISLSSLCTQHTKTNIIMKVAILLVLVAFAAVASANMCREGASWNNGCNLCRCGKGGLELCTRRGCPWGQCRPGTNWFNGCNKCVCGETGVAACTARACI